MRRARQTHPTQARARAMLASRLGRRRFRLIRAFLGGSVVSLRQRRVFNTCSPDK